MKHITIDKNQVDRWKPIQCIKNDPLTKIDIHNDCFLLLILTGGKAIFSTANETFTVIAPCIVCFNELDAPALLQQEGLENYAIYFHPTFINVNMTFERIRSTDYPEVAFVYDLFLCRPFLNPYRRISIPLFYVHKLRSCCEDMMYELQEQRDGYWSCRGRTYFIEIIILLERISSSQSEAALPPSAVISAHDLALLERAVKFIEINYSKEITLEDIVTFSRSNHTTLTALFKKKYGTTPFKYLLTYRIEIAKKQVSFTSVPLKNIATQCGFKTVQHFARIFKNYVGETPASYRQRTVAERIRKFH